MPHLSLGNLISPRRAFTLIELLVVIAIIAILAVVVVLTLNPAQLLAQSRDANRVSDLATLNSAINLYATDQAGSSNFSLGSPTVTYLSIPDPNATTTAGTDCSLMGSNFLAGGYFHCAATSTYRNVSSTGWLPIDFNAISAGSPFGSLPVDPVNSTSSNFYYTYWSNGSTYRLTANPESQKYQAELAQNPQMFTAGSAANLAGTWVPVPGNSAFGTGNFMVMKYDASCASMTTGTGLTSPLDGTAVNGYNNGGTGVGPDNCSVANGYVPTSQATGYPIVDVSEIQAKTYCAAIGAHLLTNDEYMTIDTNAVNQGSNWTGGSVGSGGAYLGNANNASAYVADPNDANGWAGETNKTVTNTNDERRTYTLSNGSVVWDMAGNLWQEVQRSQMNQGDNTNTITPPTCSNGTAGWEWCQWNSTAPYVTAYNDSSFSAATVAPPNNTWTSAQGMGQILTWGSGVNQSTNTFIRDGNWNAGAGSGPFALYLAWHTSDESYSVGFRCAR